MAGCGAPNTEGHSPKGRAAQELVISAADQKGREAMAVWAWA